MAISNISAAGNAFSSMLQKNTSSTENGASLFVNSSTASLGDYSLIQSGAYKKLLNAYYRQDSTNAAALKEEDKKENIKLSLANQDAQALNTSVSELMDMEISEDNREALKEGLKEVVKNYNSLIDSSSEVDNTSVLRNAVWMTEATKINAGLLQDIGITIGNGNKLEFNEEKFDRSMLSTVSSIVKGFDSFMGRLSSRSAAITSSAVNAVSERTASAYTSSGTSYFQTAKSTVIDSKS